jgi:hypothetical protein
MMKQRSSRRLFIDRLDFVFGSAFYCVGALSLCAGEQRGFARMQALMTRLPA